MPTDEAFGVSCTLVEIVVSTPSRALGSGRRSANQIRIERFEWGVRGFALIARSPSWGPGDFLSWGPPERGTGGVEATILTHPHSTCPMRAR